MSDWYNNWANSHLPEPITPGEKARRRSEYFRQYRERNRESLREYHRRYYRENKEKWDKPRPAHDYKACAVCGAPFYPFHFSDKYCSTKCRRSVSG